VPDHVAMNCVSCARLHEDGATLRFEYEAALELLDMTPKHHAAYIDRWNDLALASGRLHEAQRRIQFHRYMHRGS
jgi:hypothetical protein